MIKKEDKKEIIAIKIIAIILIAIFCISVTPLTLQNDTYYTIKIGEHILENGIDMKDPFSWHEDLSYTYPHWLYDVITYVIYSFFGFNGIYIFTCIFAIILGLLIYRINCKLAKNIIISFFITIGSIYLLRDHIAARAQLLTFILFILTIYCIEMFIEKKQKRYVFFLIIIPILIANLHSAVWPFYFVLYLPYFGEYIIAIIKDFIIYEKIDSFILKKKLKKLRRKDKKEKLQEVQKELEEFNTYIENKKLKRKEIEIHKIEIKKDKNVKYLVLVMVICLFTGLLTPIGDTPYTYLFKIMQGNTTQIINEHLPMTIINHIDILGMLIIFLVVLIFTKSKIRLRDLFMLCGLIYLMLMSRRQASMVALICGIILNRLIVNIILQNKKEIEEIKFINKYFIIATVIICLVISFFMIFPKFDDEIINETDYPVQASEWILKNLDLNNLRMYNEYNYGSYLLYRGIPVFIDSRCDLYTPEFNTKTGKAEDGKNIFSDFIDTSNISKFYGDLIEEYNMTHIMVYKNSKINMLIEKIGGGNYILIYSDKQFVIYEVIK